MKKIINPAPPAAVVKTKSPLNVMLSIGIVDDGTLTQSMDSTRNIWQPDRDPVSAGAGAKPLILVPQLSVGDASTGQVKTVNAVFTWYIDNVSAAWDSSKEEGKVQEYGGADTSKKYYYETRDGSSDSSKATGRFVVRKNVHHEHSKKVILVASFTDENASQTYEERAEMVLSSENRPDDFYDVKIQCPNMMRYYPLTNETDMAGNTSLATFTAVARKGRQNVSSAVKFFWFLNDAAIDASTLCYQAAAQPAGKGIGKDTIVLNMDFVDDAKLTVKIGESLNAATPLDYTSDNVALMWEFPRLELLPHTKGSKRIMDSDKKKGFGSILHSAGENVDAARRAEYIRQQWWTRASDVTAKTMRGWGEEIDIDASELRKPGNVDVDVNADPYLLGPYEVLTDDEGNDLEDDSGSSTATDFGRRVVGRC